MNIIRKMEKIENKNRNVRERSKRERKQASMVDFTMDHPVARDQHHRVHTVEASLTMVVVRRATTEVKGGGLDKCVARKKKERKTSN